MSVVDWWKSDETRDLSCDLRKGCRWIFPRTVGKGEERAGVNRFRPYRFTNDPHLSHVFFTICPQGFCATIFSESIAGNARTRIFPQNQRNKFYGRWQIMTQKQKQASTKRKLCRTPSELVPHPSEIAIFEKEAEYEPSAECEGIGEEGRQG